MLSIKHVTITYARMQASKRECESQLAQRGTLVEELRREAQLHNDIAKECTHKAAAAKAQLTEVCQ